MLLIVLRYQKYPNLDLKIPMKQYITIIIISRALKKNSP